MRCRSAATALRIARSFSVSSELVASSRIRRSGWRSSARAKTVCLAQLQGIQKAGRDRQHAARALDQVGAQTAAAAHQRPHRPDQADPAGEGEPGQGRRDADRRRQLGDDEDQGDDYVQRPVETQADKVDIRRQHGEQIGLAQPHHVLPLRAGERTIQAAAQLIDELQAIPRRQHGLVRAQDAGRRDDHDIHDEHNRQGRRQADRRERLPRPARDAARRAHADRTQQRDQQQHPDCLTKPGRRLHGDHPRQPARALARQRPEKAAQAYGV